MTKRDFDAVVVGSGPNGLAAAIALQREGLSVLLLEGKDTLGGGLRSAALTLPGFTHDVCSAIHPLAATSPFLQTLPLREHGLEYIYPPLAAAHPFDDGTAAVLGGTVAETAARLGEDAGAYQKLLGPVAADWPRLAGDVLGPLHFPSHPFRMAHFGLKAVLPALLLAKFFKTPAAKGLWAGMAAHSIQPLSHLTTSAIGLVLMAAAHRRGWPLPRGGSQAIADALVAYFRTLGGKVESGVYVQKLEQLPSARAVLFDVTPRQLLGIAGHRFSSLYQWQLERYRYGMGVFKVDWALDGPVPFTAPRCGQAGTVHLGNTLEEVAWGERITWEGQHPERPFVLLAQQSLFDPTRAPAGKHTAWAYCHVPHGSRVDMTAGHRKAGGAVCTGLPGTHPVAARNGHGPNGGLQPQLRRRRHQRRGHRRGAALYPAGPAGLALPDVGPGHLPVLFVNAARGRRTRHVRLPRRPHRPPRHLQAPHSAGAGSTAGSRPNRTNLLKGRGRNRASRPRVFSGNEINNYRVLYYRVPNRGVNAVGHSRAAATFSTRYENLFSQRPSPADRFLRAGAVRPVFLPGKSFPAQSGIYVRNRPERSGQSAL
jgi:phytoene dehydrogenase-like protein